MLLLSFSSQLLLFSLSHQIFCEFLYWLQVFLFLSLSASLLLSLSLSASLSSLSLFASLSIPSHANVSYWHWCLNLKIKKCGISWPNLDLLYFVILFCFDKTHYKSFFKRYLFASLDNVYFVDNKYVMRELLYNIEIYITWFLATIFFPLNYNNFLCYLKLGI